MKHSGLVFILILLASTAAAQNRYNIQTATTPPESGRFELITSSIAMKDTYLLDKETGVT